MNDATITILHLSLIPGVGPATIHKIIKAVGFTNLLNIYSFSMRQFQEQCALTNNAAQLVFDGLREKKLVEDEYALINKNHIHLVTFFDEQYPEKLKQIHVPPILLYVAGNKTINYQRSLALVGARDASAYAQRAIEHMVPQLCAHQAIVVSGGALGVDGIVHATALKEQGITVAVLGSGLLKRYPTQHNRLFETIIEHDGALISIFPLETDPLAGNFPARNRVIAGLADGCVVVQAKEKSGALITAGYALQEGRELFAVPGPIDDPLSAGCNQLIKEGAHLVTTGKDILDVFRFRWLLSDEQMNSAQKLSGQKETESSNSLPKTNEPKLQEEKSQNKLLTIKEKITAACKEPKTIAELMNISTLDLPTLQQYLVELSLEGYIRQTFTGDWCIS